MKMLSTLILGMLLLPHLVFSQQCRQVTVCNEESSNVIKGDKGDVGSPGKAGPVGSRGLKGEVGGVGQKGMQGESCALGSFESTFMSKLAGTVISWDQNLPSAFDLKALPFAFTFKKIYWISNMFFCNFHYKLHFKVL